MPMKTGFTEIDSDHELLLKAIDDVVVAILREEPRERVLARCHSAFAFFQEHFAREERALSEHDSSDLTVLRNEHARLLSRMQEMKTRFEADPDAYRDSENVGEMRRMYLRHIRQYDVPIFTGLRARQRVA